VAEEQRLGIEAAEAGAETRQFVVEALLEPRSAQPLAH